MQKCFHKPVLNTLLINILNQNRLQFSQPKKKKKENPFTSSLLKLFLEVIVKRTKIYNTIRPINSIMRPIIIQKSTIRPMNNNKNKLNSKKKAGF